VKLRCCICERLRGVVGLECGMARFRRLKWWIPHLWAVSCTTHVEHRFLAFGFRGHRLDESIVSRIAARAAGQPFRIYVAKGTFVPDLLSSLTVSRHGRIVVV
jgi:hypothetical protein